ncbi:hypothetical protein MMC18_009465 [Xylographa bjoerkii]|nr:hypothetical protein [Xylographa bjoerkii]
MASTTTRTYLITGANRGIGKGLVMTYLSRPSTIVIAGVRDPLSASSKALHELPVGHGSKVIVVKIDSSSETDAATAMKKLQSVHNINRLDVVIANAGIAGHLKTVAEQTVAELQEHITVNAIGPLVLFKAVYPLLKASAEPKFVVVGSPMGSIGGMESRPYPALAYGASKAMVHYITRKIHLENEWLVAFVLDPGFVQTDMGNMGAVAVGLAEAPTTIKDSVDYLITTIDGSTRDKTSGHFPSIAGGDFAW